MLISSFGGGKLFAYANKILRINLNGEIKEIELDENLAKYFIGGSGLAAYYLYKMKIYDFKAFSAKNVVAMFNGPLTGTKAPSTSRLEFCAKSPLTEIWGESNVGGKMAAFLKFAGWDGVIIEGQSDKPVYIYINENGAEIRSANGIWGKGCYEAQKAIEKEIKERRLSTAVIGQAGENLVRYACIQVDNSRHAGRTGIGAVLGAKKIKGIAVSYDTKHEIEIADSSKFEEEIKALNERIKDNFTCNMLKELGTAGYVESAEMFGDLPVKYFTQGTFDKASEISGSKMAQTFLKTNDGCFGCSIKCGRVVEIDGKTIHGPEYETIASFGSLQLIDDLRSLIEINYLLNDYGMDSISSGVVIAYAMWLSEKSIHDFGIKWGDVEGVKKLIRDIAFKKGDGAILAEGVRRVGKKFKDENAAHVKGLEIPMHDPRAFSSLAIAYAAHNRGACHLPHQMYNVEMGLKIKEYGIISKDRFSSESKGIITARMQNYAEIFNCATMCVFVPIKPTQMANLLKFATGFNFDVNKIYTIGERIYNLKRMFNVRCGIKAGDDVLPKIVLQPLKGGSEENVPDLKLQKKEYYKERRWSEEGIPTREKLEELGIAWTLESS